MLNPFLGAKVLALWLIQIVLTISLHVESSSKLSMPITHQHTCEYSTITLPGHCISEILHAWLSR